MLRRNRRNLPKRKRRLKNKTTLAAEPLLRKLVERDPASYVGWFDLGLCGECCWVSVDESIAAYRKSVAAKPDVFESNLNLGIATGEDRSARCGEFPAGCDSLNTDQSSCRGSVPRVARTGDMRSNPLSRKRRSAPTSTRRLFNPKRPSRIFWPGSFSNRKISLPMPSRNTSWRWHSIRVRPTPSLAWPISTCAGDGFPRRKNICGSCWLRMEVVMLKTRPQRGRSHSVGARTGGRRQDR